MLNLNSIMLGTSQPKVMADFYEKVLGRAPEMVEEGWAGWMVGNCFFGIGEHSDVQGMAPDPARMIFNLETPEVKKEFDRLKSIATVVKEPYEMGGMWIATLADPDGNYFQLMSPWEEEKEAHGSAN